MHGPPASHPRSAGASARQLRRIAENAKPSVAQPSTPGLTAEAGWGILTRQWKKGLSGTCFPATRVR